MEKPKLARVFWLSVLTPAFCNIPNLSTLGLMVSNQLPHAAIAAVVRHWEYDPYTNELQITSEETPHYFILADPPRIVIDIPNSNFGKNSIQENYPGLVRTIRISEFKPGQTRIVMELDPRVALNPGQVQLEPLGQGNRWVLRPQLRVSQTLPSLEAAESLPQLPQVSQIGEQPKNAIVVPLPSATVPISSDIGLPTEQVTPTLGEDMANGFGDRNITVTVPSLDQVTSTAELASQETETFVPPPPPPEWQVGPEIEPPAIVSVPTSPSIAESFTDPRESMIESVTETETLPRSPNPEWQEITPRDSSSAIVIPPREYTSSLPPYSEWQEITPRDSSSAIANASLSSPVITFGESLPTPANQSNTLLAVNSTNLPNGGNDEGDREITEVEILDQDILLAAGSIIILRYPGSEGFTLKSDSSRREVLIVDVDIYDRNGRVIAPVGTPVIGSFESDRSGSRFVVESMVINGDMVPMVAESETIAGDRTGSGGGLLSWSTLGAVGGAAIGGLAGGPLLGGAAAGVAANLLSSPKQLAIEPGQAIPVRVIEHWLSNQP